MHQVRAFVIIFIIIEDMNNLCVVAPKSSNQGSIVLGSVIIKHPTPKQNKTKKILLQTSHY